jgi:DNA topoisomerase-1
VLGAHPKDKRPVELHAGRFGPYVKHGAVNATLPDKDGMDALTLADAIALLAAKSGKLGGKLTSKAASTSRGAKSPKVATTTSPKVTARKSPKATTRKKVTRKPKAAKPPAKTAIRKRGA